MVATALPEFNLEEAVKAYMAEHANEPDLDEFRVRSVLALRKMSFDAPETVVEKTVTGGRSVNIGLLASLHDFVSRQKSG